MNSTITGSLEWSRFFSKYYFLGYFIGIGYYRLKEYELVIKQMKKILNYEKQNHQALNLMNEAEKRLKRDGLIGIGVAAGAAAVGELD